MLRIQLEVRMDKGIKANASSLLAAFVKDKSMTEADAKTLLKLPLVELPETGPDVENEWCSYLDSDEANKRDDVIITRDDFVLLEAAYWMPGFGFYVFELHPSTFESDEYGPLQIKFQCFNLNTNADEKRIIIKGNVTITADSRETLVDYKNVTVTYKGKTSANIQDNEKVAGMVISKITYGLRLVHFFTAFHESLDLYPVHVTRKESKRLLVGTNKTEKRLENVRTNSPRVVYLNALPEEYNKANTIPGGEPVPRKLHPRKGYWKTLRDERYAKHPKYLVEKAIRVKPAWVGSVKGEYNGNVYKVILPSTDKQSE